MKMIQLFEEARRLPPGDQAMYVSARLPAVMAGSPISVWHPPSPSAGAARRVLLGIAPYSIRDLELVDALVEALGKRHVHRDDVVQVFDVSTCASMKDIDDHIPGIGQVYQTPVVGIWENGNLIEMGSGAKARQLIMARYNLNG